MKPYVLLRATSALTFTQVIDMTANAEIENWERFIKESGIKSIDIC